MPAGASAPLDSVARLEHDRARPAVDPLLRTDAPRGDRRGRCDHRACAGRGAGGDWDLIFRVAVWGVALGDRRRAALPRHHELERASGRVVGADRDLERRARCLGRDRAGLPRRRDRREPLRRRRSRGSPTASLRRSSSHRASVASATGGTRSSSASPPTCRGASRSTRPTGRSTYIDSRDVPSDVPLRGALVLRRGGCAAAHRASLPGAASGRAACSRSMYSSTASGASGSRPCASILRTRSPASA